MSMSQLDPLFTTPAIRSTSADDLSARIVAKARTWSGAQRLGCRSCDRCLPQRDLGASVGLVHLAQRALFLTRESIRQERGEKRDADQSDEAAEPGQHETGGKEREGRCQHQARGLQVERDQALELARWDFVVADIHVRSQERLHRCRRAGPLFYRNAAPLRRGLQPFELRLRPHGDQISPRLLGESTRFVGPQALEVVIDAVGNDRVPLADQDLIALGVKERDELLGRVPERHRFEVLELALDRVGLIAVPRIRLEHEQVVTLGIDLEMVDVLDLRRVEIGRQADRLDLQRRLMAVEERLEAAYARAFR